MKILLFSDTHLFKKFEEKKFKFLKKIISGSDKVIILGDFWDNSLISFDEFIKSDWNNLFPLLKEKHAVYVYGNHDKKEFSDERVSLFSDTQAERYAFEIDGKLFAVEHGDRFFRKHITYYLTYGGPLRAFFMSKLFITWRFLVFDELLTKLFGKAFLNKRLHYNQYIKKVKIDEFKKGEILICGHTHAAEIDLKNNFINTGLVRHGIGQYVIIDGKNISLQEEWYSKSLLLD
jgi:predicted phosphodiesterase